MNYLDSAASETLLVWRTAQGDVEAFADLYDKYSTALFSLAVEILNDPGEAEELTEEVFLKIWQEAHSFDESKGNPLSWSVQMARNQAIDRLRKRKNDEHFAGLTTEVAFRPAAGAKQSMGGVSGQYADGIGLDFNRLPHDDRKIIDLAFFGGRSLTTMADLMGVPPGTINARVRSAMVSLSDIIEVNEASTIKGVSAGTM
jgi:RNA polymerase sigma factor (sigma-70 family)